MLHCLPHHFQDFLMSIGNSGRIVIEVDPAIKKDLYSLLAKEGMTLKEWFLKNAAVYLNNELQIPSNNQKGNAVDMSGGMKK
jgi:hypothetical protein